MRVVWQKQEILTSWSRAGGILIPKDIVYTSEFHQICHFIHEGKIFFSMVTHRLSEYLEGNHFINISIDKVGIP